MKETEPLCFRSHIKNTDKLIYIAYQKGLDMGTFVKFKTIDAIREYEEQHGDITKDFLKTLPEKYRKRLRTLKLSI